MLPAFLAFLPRGQTLPVALTAALLSGALAAQAPSRDLEASLALLPGLADDPGDGAFVELVKAMDELYPGTIHIAVYPFARSYDNVKNGKADFHIPAMRNPAVPNSRLGYRYAAERMGSVAFVLYSRVDRVITKQDILRALEKGGGFPYVVEVSAGAEANCVFPARPTNSFEQSLRPARGDLPQGARSLQRLAAGGPGLVTPPADPLPAPGAKEPHAEQQWPDRLFRGGHPRLRTVPAGRPAALR